MRNPIQLLALMFTLSICLSCGPKTKEGASENESSVTTEEAAKKAEERVAKRARIEAARKEKVEQRRLAAIEAAKTSPTYTDASGRVIYNLAEIDPSYTGGN